MTSDTTSGGQLMTRDELLDLIQKQAERIGELKCELEEAKDELRETVEILNRRFGL